MKFSIIIEARVSSSRFPRKILYKIQRYSFLEYLIKRLKLLKTIREIIIAMPDDEQNEEIVLIAKKNKIKYFKGSHQNVIKRMIDAAKKFKCKNIIRITSDCPLIDLDIIKNAIEIFRYNNCDILTNGKIRSFPDGMDVEIFKLGSLIKSYKYAKSKKDREWPTWAMKKKNNKFNIINFISPPNLYWPKLCLTLDEYKDFLFLKKIITHFNERFEISCLEIMKYLKKNKKLLDINKSVKRKYSSINYLKY
tara:strand:+ start:1480 stop:2229 length:750 start_codon:yes stop_codon:yes gene_type:complete